MGGVWWILLVGEFLLFPSGTLKRSERCNLRPKNLSLNEISIACDMVDEQSMFWMESNKYDQTVETMDYVSAKKRQETINSI